MAVHYYTLAGTYDLSAMGGNFKNDYRHETKRNKTKQNAEKDVVGEPFNVVTMGAIMSIIERRKF